MAKPLFEIVDAVATPIGLLELRRRRLPAPPGTVVTEITINDDMLMSSLTTVSERALTTSALDLHAGDGGLQVLVGGLGLGYTASEALKSSRVHRVEVVELLPEVVGFMRGGLVPLSAELAAEPRFGVREGDVFALLNEPANEHWDIVLIDVDNSPQERLDLREPDPQHETANEAFYSEPGLARAKQHLAPGGILAVWSYVESSPFVEALRATFTNVEAIPVTYENDLVDEELTDWLFVARD